MNCIKDIEKLSDLRLNEAICLLNNKYFHGSFYLAGYSVELILKARICKNLDIEHFYSSKLKHGDKAFFNHDLEQLLTLSGLRTKFEVDCLTDIPLKLNWDNICLWNEGKRYEFGITEKDTEKYIDSITNNKNGFLQWIRLNW